MNDTPKSAEQTWEDCAERFATTTAKKYSADFIKKKPGEFYLDTWFFEVAYLGYEKGMAAAQQKWVAVSERLPENDHVVMILYNSPGHHGHAFGHYDADPHFEGEWKNCS